MKTQDGTEKLLACNTVIAAFGTKPYNPLQEAAEAHCSDVQIIGDCRSAETITTAIHDGFFAALEL